MKRDSLDAAFSDLIREAWDWTCARCGRQFPERKGKDVHASHFYSRQFNSTRWFVDNAVCLCATCHDYVGKHPDDHVSLIRRVLGDTRYQWLQARKRLIVRYRAADKKAMRKHYSAELERIKAMRLEGHTGLVTPVTYD